jgi:hypothetical protein
VPGMLMLTPRQLQMQVPVVALQMSARVWALALHLSRVSLLLSLTHKK